MPLPKDPFKDLYKTTTSKPNNVVPVKVNNGTKNPFSDLYGESSNATIIPNPINTTTIKNTPKEPIFSERLQTNVPGKFVNPEYQDIKKPVVKLLSYQELQKLTPQDKEQYKSLLKKDITDALPDTTLKNKYKPKAEPTVVDNQKYDFINSNPYESVKELSRFIANTAIKKVGINATIPKDKPSIVSKFVSDKTKQLFNTPVGKELQLKVVETTENKPIQLLSLLGSVPGLELRTDTKPGDTYKEILNKWVEAGTDPNSPTWKKFLYQTQSSLGQTGIGVLLNISANSIAPGSGTALSSAYWAALSGGSQIQSRGKVYSLSNIGIDVALDSWLGNNIEGIFKKGSKDFLIKTMAKSGFGEGGTEVSQSLLKYMNDYLSAPNTEVQQNVIKQATKYVTSGDMFMEFASSFVSGGLLAGGGQQASKTQTGSVGDKATLEEFNLLNEQATLPENQNKPDIIQKLTDTKNLLDNKFTSAKESVVSSSLEGSDQPLIDINVADMGDGKWVVEYNANTSDKGLSSDYISNGTFNTKEEAINKAKEDISKWVNENLDTVSNQAYIQLQNIMSRLNSLEATKQTETPIETTKEQEVEQTPATEEITPYEAKTTPEQDLIQEAKKYKSAEEFVKAQPKLYHGGEANIKEVDLGKSRYNQTFYLTDNLDYAKSTNAKTTINELVLDTKANLADMTKPNQELISQIEKIAKGTETGKTITIKKPDGTSITIPETPKDSISFYPYSKEQVIQGIKDGKAHFAELEGVKNILKKLGYDGQITSEVPYAKNIGVWNKDVIKTKSQLIDIWNKANQPTDLVSEAKKYSNKDKFLMSQGALTTDTSYNEKKRLLERADETNDMGEWIDEFSDELKALGLKNYDELKQDVESTKRLIEKEMKLSKIWDDAQKNNLSWSELRKADPELFNTGILRKDIEPYGAKGIIPADVHSAQGKWQNYGQDSEIPASVLYDRVGKGKYAFTGGSNAHEYVDSQGFPVRDPKTGDILEDIYNEDTGEWVEPTVSNKQLKDNLLESFSTPEGEQYLNQVIDALPKNDDGTITAYRIGSISKGIQSYTLSEGMAKTFSNQGTDILPAGTPGLPKGGYKDFGVLPTNIVKIDPKGIKAWSPYDAEILVDSKSVKPINDKAQDKPTPIFAKSTPADLTEKQTKIKTSKITKNTALNKGDIIYTPEVGRFIVSDVEVKVTPEGKTNVYTLKDSEGNVFEETADNLVGFSRNEKVSVDISKKNKEVQPLGETNIEINGQGENKLGASDQKVLEPVASAPKPIETENKKKLSSSVFERMKVENPAIEGSLGYNPLNLEKDAQKAVELVSTDKQKAYRIGMGIETSTEVTSTAVNIALAEVALKEGNTSLYSQLIKNRSLEQTRRGQEIVAEKGSISDNNTSRYVKELIAARMDSLGNKYLADLKLTLKSKQSKKSNAIGIIDQEISKQQEKIKNKTIDFKEAQSLLDKLTC